MLFGGQQKYMQHELEIIWTCARSAHRRCQIE